MSTTTSRQPFRIRLAMRGIRPLFVDENLVTFLDVLERSPFAPDRWSINERGALPYSRDEVRAYAARGNGRPMRQAYAFVKRSKKPKYVCGFELDDRPGFSMDCNAKMPERYWEPLFQLGDELANACRPDWGACHLYEQVAADQPASPDAIDGELFYGAAHLAPIDYYDHGPEGLAMRTYIGPRFVEQLGEERIRSLPAEVTRMDWGGYRVDVVPRPWLASLPDLLAAWRRCMERLRPADVLAIPQFATGRVREFAKAARCRIEDSE